MIKGCKKKMIFIKDTKSDFFDEAYFVLKGDIDYSYTSESDIVKAAAMIINEFDENKQKGARKKRKAPRFLLGFFLGLLISSAILGLFLIFY
ncbi:MAG: hypothetical protein IJZ93_02065 [Clostridia bacterium]|nr:hypothetical protein [Clostridia bacterium]